MICFSDIVPDVPAHKPRAVTIGTVVAGKVTPEFNLDGTLRWHAVLKPTDAGPSVSWLIQGFGVSPRAAVLDAIVRERARQAHERAAFVLIERALGVAGLMDVQVRALGGGAT